MKRNRYHFKARNSVISVALFTALSLMIVLPVQDSFNQVAIAKANEDIQTKKVLELSQKEKELDRELEDMRWAVKIATASPKRQQLTAEEAKEMIRTTFPEKYQKRFMEITMKCENGRLDSHATNVNKGGSKDIGMSQINDKWHRARVEKMFGLEFEVAMKMPLLNYIYAAYLVEHSQNFELWACDRILK